MKKGRLEWRRYLIGLKRRKLNENFFQGFLWYLNVNSIHGHRVNLRDSHLTLFIAFFISIWKIQFGSHHERENWVTIGGQRPQSQLIIKVARELNSFTRLSWSRVLSRLGMCRNLGRISLNSFVWLVVGLFIRYPYIFSYFIDFPSPVLSTRRPTWTWNRLSKIQFLYIFILFLLWLVKLSHMIRQTRPWSRPNEKFFFFFCVLNVVSLYLYLLFIIYSVLEEKKNAKNEM